jgi:hypothetical protein
MIVPMMPAGLTHCHLGVSPVRPEEVVGRERQRDQHDRHYPPHDIPDHRERGSGQADVTLDARADRRAEHDERRCDAAEDQRGL